MHERKWKISPLSRILEIKLKRLFYTQLLLFKCQLYHLPMFDRFLRVCTVFCIEWHLCLPASPPSFGNVCLWHFRKLRLSPSFVGQKQLVFEPLDVSVILLCGLLLRSIKPFSMVPLRVVVCSFALWNPVFWAFGTMGFVRGFPSDIGFS